MWMIEYKNVRTMTTFLKRHGVHRPSKKTVVVDLNRELLSPTFEDIRELIDNWKTHLVPVKARLKSDLGLLLAKIETELRKNSSFGGKPMQTFRDQFRLHKINADKTFDALFESILGDVEQCFQDLGGDGAKHEFHEAMNKLYDNCLDQRVYPKGTLKISVTR